MSSRTRAGHAELTTWLGWFLPVSMLERNPTLRAEMADIETGGRLHARRSVPVAFYTYPVMQVANILMPRAHLVPVGETAAHRDDARGCAAVQPAIQGGVSGARGAGRARRAARGDGRAGEDEQVEEQRHLQGRRRHGHEEGHEHVDASDEPDGAGRPGRDTCVHVSPGIQSRRRRGSRPGGDIAKAPSATQR